MFLLSTAVATSGMMFTSCKDYDDDIDSINKKLEDLSGQIALKADQKAFETLQSKLEGVNFSDYVTQDKLTQELGKYVTSTDLAAKLADYVTSKGLDTEIANLGYKKTEDINKLIDQKLSGIKQWSKEDIEAIFNTQIGAYDIWGRINSDVSREIQNALKDLDTSISQKDINAVISAIVGQINEGSKDVKDAIINLLGEEFGLELDKTYVTEDMLNGYVKSGELSNYVQYSQLTGKINEQLTAANATLKNTIEQIISQTVTDNDKAANVTDTNIAWLEKNELEDTFKEYDAKISLLWSAVGNLVNRIQSLVFVPTTDNGKAYFDGHKVGDISLTKGEGRKAMMTFRVSPASLAESIAKGYNEDKTVELNFLPEKVATRAAAPSFTIEGKVDAKDGKISMLVSTDYTYPNTSETYSVALQVIERKTVVRPAEEEGKEDDKYETGTEFTTDYIATVGGDKEDVFKKIVLAKKTGEKDGKPVFGKVLGSVEYSLEYNKTNEAHKLLDEQTYMFAYEVETDVLISLDSAATLYNWDYVPSAEPVIERTFFDMNEAADLSLNPEEPMNATNERITIGLKKENKSNIDKKVVEIGKLYVSVKTENNAIQTIKRAADNTDKGYETVVTITRQLLGTIEIPVQTFGWKYDYPVSFDFDGDGSATMNNFGYKNSATYFSEKAVRFDEGGVLSADNFKALNWNGATWTIEASDEFKAVNAGLNVSAMGEGDPFSGTEDSKHLRYKVENYKNGNGTIAVSADVEVSDVAMVTLKGTINFEGMPDMDYKIEGQDNASYSVVGDNLKVDLASDIYAKLLEANPNHKAYFGDDLDAFRVFMTKTTPNNNFKENDRPVSPTNSAKFSGLRLDGNNQSLWAFFKSNYVDFDKVPAQEGYTYSVPAGVNMFVEDAGFHVNFEGKVTIKKGAYYLAKGLDLFGDGSDENPYYMKATGTRSGSSFSVANVQLENAFKANVSGAVVTYKVADKPQNYTSDNYPTNADNNKVLVWNSCGLDKVTVTAELTVDNVLMDRKTFEVRLVNPIVYSTTNPAQDTSNNRNVVKVKVNETASINVLNGLTLKDIYNQGVIDPGTFQGGKWTKSGSVNSDAATAYGFAVNYGEIEYRILVNGEYVEAGDVDFSRLTFNNVSTDTNSDGNGVYGDLIVGSSDTSLAHNIEVTVPVEMTYTYSLDDTYEKKVETKKVKFYIQNAQ